MRKDYGKCEHCGEEVEPVWEEDSNEWQATGFCPECGKAIAHDQKYCGERL